MVRSISSAAPKLTPLIISSTCGCNAWKIIFSNGSLSGEHGDGRLRGEFIPFMMGEKNYALFKEVKAIFDPKGVFNKGKIVDTPPMDAALRYAVVAPKKALTTIYNFNNQGGYLRLAEKCSGSGDCRKTEVTGGTMCPSYMATRSEQDTTRARANILRQYLTNEETNFVSDEEVKEILDLCLSCKACKSECPSSVDVAKMKGEFMQSYYDKHGVPFRSQLIGDFSKGSDSNMIDLILIGNIDKSYLINLIEKAEKLVSRKIRYVIYSEYEFQNLDMQKINPKPFLIWSKD